MDTPRRWQLASLATAVASLGLGTALISRPGVEAVPTIDLDRIETTADVDVTPVPDLVLDPDPAGPSIVPPRAFSTPTPEAVSAASVSSADDAEPAEPSASTGGRTEAEPTPSASGDDAPSPASVASPASVDSSD